MVLHNRSPSLSPPTTECQHGRYLNSDDLRRKVLGIWFSSMLKQKIYPWTYASYQGWVPKETTVRNTNYSIDPLDNAFFNDPFYRLFGNNRVVFSIYSCCTCKTPSKFTVPRMMPLHFHYPPWSAKHGRHLNPENLCQIEDVKHSNSVRSVKMLDVTSRFIEPDPFDIQSNWSKGLIGVFPPQYPFSTITGRNTPQSCAHLICFLWQAIGLCGPS